MVPFFLLGSVLLTALGVGGMAWYNSLTKEQKEVLFGATQYAKH